MPETAPQAIALPGSKEPGYSSIYRNAKFRDALIRSPENDVTTLFEAFEKSVKERPRERCMGQREYDRVTKTWGPYVWHSYEGIQARRNNFGSGILTLFEQVARVESLCSELTCSPLVH
jgi:long-chain acyl-CoA synthetase